MTPSPVPPSPTPDDDDRPEGDGHGPADGGVADRLRRRTRAGAVGFGVVAAGVALLGWTVPGWFVGVTGTVIGVVALAVIAAPAAVLLHRSALWAQAARQVRCAAPDKTPMVDAGVPVGAPAPPGWHAGTCAAPQRLNRQRPGLQFARVRRPANLLPVRTVAGALQHGEVVLLHGRADGLLPPEGARIQVLAIAARGPYMIREDGGQPVFLADRWWFSAL